MIETLRLRRCLCSRACQAVVATVIAIHLTAIRGAERIDPAGIQGSLVICGGGKLPSAARSEFLKLAGGKAAHIIVIPTAHSDEDQKNADAGLKSWQDVEPASVSILHTRSRTEADTPEFVTPLQSATAVWFDGGSQSRIADAYLGTAVEREVMAVLQRGGVIGGTSAGAAIMSRVMIAQGNPVAEVKTGLDLLPGCVIDQHFMQRNRLPRLKGVLESRPDLFGLGIDEDTAVIIRGRDMHVVGDGQVRICLAASTSRPGREISFSGGEQTDLTRWRLAARGRTEHQFPAPAPASPRVANGSLVIVGGGGLTPEIVNRFIELAGGPDSTIVVLPTANPPPPPGRTDNEGRFLERAGCKHVVTLSGRSLADVSSPGFLDTIKQSRGIWFGGGRQWRFMDAYAGTPAEAAFQDLLQRGGVIGGSSAGATIQGEYLVRGSPQGNTEMMAEGYERGLGFLPGTAIDQHFTQRNRHPDLLAVMSAHPQLLGIGLDETTAIVVRGSIAEVLGKNQAHFFDTRRKNDKGEPEHAVVNARQRYDLVERRVMESDTPAAKNSRQP